jgi:hypothetical protein
MNRKRSNQMSDGKIFLIIFGLVLLAFIISKFWLIIVIVLSIIAIVALAIYFSNSRITRAIHPARIKGIEISRARASSVTYTPIRLAETKLIEISRASASTEADSPAALASISEFPRESIAPEKNESSPLPGPGREPLSPWIRGFVYRRANQRCENPFCKIDGVLEIHHINMNRNENRLYNLIALCPNCHKNAHSGKYPPTQVHNWMSMDYQRSKQESGAGRQPN